MVTKTISIMEDAYKLLLNKKHKNESFSEVIRRIVRKERDIMQFAGAWKHISDAEAESMKKHIYNLNKHSTKELLHRLKKYDLP